MARPKAKPTKTGLPKPRALNDLRAIRIEVASIYRAAKAGHIEPGLFGRLVHCLMVLAAITRDSELEARLEALEAAAASAEASWGPPISTRRPSVRVTN